MRKMKYFNKKAIVALGICCGLAGYVFMNHRSEASAADADTNIGGMDIGYHQCENNMEEILDEDVSETISIQVIDLQEKGETYQVSDAVELENGYYHHIEKEGGHSVVTAVVWVQSVAQELLHAVDEAKKNQNKQTNYKRRK